MIAGLLDKNGNVQPFISLDKYLNLDKLDDVRKEVEEFIGEGVTEIDFFKDESHVFDNGYSYRTKELVKLKKLNTLVSQILTDVDYLRIIPNGGDTRIHNDVETELVYPEKQTFTDDLRSSLWFWIRFSDKKKFFIIDPETHEKYYVTGRVILFNNWDYHGTDEDVPSTEISIRMFGNPTENFKTIALVSKGYLRKN